MKRFWFCLLAMLPIFIFGKAISLISEDVSSLRLNFEMPEFSLDEIKSGGEIWQQIVCDEGAYTAEEGYPQLKMFAVPIAIPVDGHVSAELVSSRQRELSDVRLLPVPEMLVDGEKVEYQTRRDFMAYQRASAYPSQILEVSEPAFVGDRRFVTLRVYPFRYYAASERLTILEDIEILVTIGGTKRESSNWRLSENPIDKAGDSFFINNQSSLGWRLEKTRDYSYSSPKSSLNGVNEIQFVVDEEGIYQVSYDDLKELIVEMTDSLNVDMAWDIDKIDPRRLELSDRNGQVPMHFVGENNGKFNQGDYFEFYGDRLAGENSYFGAYTAENVYILKPVEGYGARMVVENGGLVDSNAANYIRPEAYEHTVHFEQQLITDKLGQAWSSSNPEYYREDNWFWRRISAPNLDIVPVRLQYPLDSDIQKGSAKVSLQGLTYVNKLPEGQFDHDATIRINQSMIASHSWAGQTEQVFVADKTITNSFLKHGENSVYISLSGNTPSGNNEQVLLDYINLTYWREYKTDEDFIKFSKPSNRPNGLYQFEVHGFSSSNISVYKIGSSIFSSTQIEPFNIGGHAPWSVSFQDSVHSQSVRYYAVEESAKKTPKQMRLSLPSDLKNPMNSANVVVVAPYEFTLAEGTLDLVDLWESEGHSVMVVDVQNIYNEFNHGIVSADAIKDFFRYAYNNWSSPQLSHAILLGEGISDTRDNSPSRKYNLIPVRKIWTDEHGATASDNWYACIVGNDLVPDISVARITAWEVEQIADYAAKARSYRENLQTNRLWNSTLTFTAGGKIDDGHDMFSQQSEKIRKLAVPEKYLVKRVYTSTQTVSREYFGGTFDLKDAINSGTQYVQFMGHGGGMVWADYNLFNRNDIATLNNRTYPVFLSLSCYASAFDTNGSASISEALILQANKGAIATLGFVGLAYLYQDVEWGLAFCEAAFEQDFPTLGDAYIYTLARFFTTTSNVEARYALTSGSAYLGDPLIRLNKPSPEVEVSLSAETLNPGETINVQAEFPTDVNMARLYVLNENEIVQNVPYDMPVVGGNFSANYTVPQNLNNYMNRIRVAGYSSQKEYIGSKKYAVGRANIEHLAFIPEAPAYSDSIGFKVSVFSPSAVTSMICKVRTDSVLVNNQWRIIWVDLPMVQSSADSNIWVTSVKLDKQRSGKELFYKYRLTDNLSRTYENRLTSFLVKGPDLMLTNIEFVDEGGVPKLRVKSINIGNVAAPITDLRTYYRLGEGSSFPSVLFSTQDFAPLGVNEERWDEIPLTGAPHGILRIEVRVNASNAFSELHFFVNTNNYINIVVPFNYHDIDSSGGVFSSVDNNVDCLIPSGFVTGNSTLSINTIKDELPHHQPDLHGILMRNPAEGLSSQSSIAYDVHVFDSAAVDSLGFFRGGKRLELVFKYHATDEETQEYEGDNSYKLYRWNQEFERWILLGGHISTSNNTVGFEIIRNGVYSIFRNTDTQAPTIDVNVEDQEFTLGGYVSSDGVVSILLSDANGIDVIDDSIKLYLNGSLVDDSEYVISVNKDNISSIPVKYQLNLDAGIHELKVDCSDLNGNFVTRVIQFTVNKKFNIVNIGNYPNPVVGRAQDPRNDGRTRFTYVLTDSADEVYIKLYTVSGRLVKTFKDLPVGVGYHEYPRSVHGWDCRDDQGYTLANGVYFYKVVARKGKHKIEKTMKMAILR